MTEQNKSAGVVPDGLAEVAKKLDFIINREKFTFAECTDAEDIIAAAKEARAMLAAAPTPPVAQAGEEVTPLPASMEGWTFSLKPNGTWIIESPSGDTACVFHDDESPLGEVVRQMLQTMAFGSSTQPAAVPADCDVRKILLRVVPGDDGEGVEVYAHNNDDVVELLGTLDSELEAAAQPAAVRSAGLGDTLDVVQQQFATKVNGIVTQYRITASQLADLRDLCAPAEPVSSAGALFLPDAPERIYLVIEDDNGAQPFASFKEAQESAANSKDYGMTWSANPIGESDIEYIRAPAYISPTAAEVRREALEEIMQQRMIGNENWIDMTHGQEANYGASPHLFAYRKLYTKPINADAIRNKALEDAAMLAEAIPPDEVNILPFAIRAMASQDREAS